VQHEREARGLYDDDEASWSRPFCALVLGKKQKGREKVANLFFFGS
jgi:hypothetical protein